MGDSPVREPDLLRRAQRAATELERASDRWHTSHGLDTEPMPSVSSYVGYSLERPWGHPRVVVRIEARQAEQLAALLDHHDCTGPVYARTEPAQPQPRRRTGTLGRHAAGGPAAVSPGTAQGHRARGYTWQAYGAAAQALADPEDQTGPQGYPLPRPGRLYAVPSAPGSSRAQDYSTSLREAAEQDAAAIRQQAAQEAATLTRQALQEAARIREAAEKEAAELRAALAAMSGEMGRVAAYVAENLAVPTIPATRPAPAARPAPVTRPAPAPVTRPAPAARPEPGAPGRPRPTTAPAAPAREPGKRTRQQKAMRVSKFAVAAGLLGVAAAASTEFALHGPSFFVFRQSGTGETPGNNTDQDFLAQQAKPAKPKPKVVKPATRKTAPAPRASH